MSLTTCFRKRRKNQKAEEKEKAPVRQSVGKSLFEAMWEAVRWNPNYFGINESVIFAKVRQRFFCAFPEQIQSRLLLEAYHEQGA